MAIKFKVGDKVKIVHEKQHYLPEGKRDYWHTPARRHQDSEGWWFLVEGNDGIPFNENEMIKAHTKPTVIIYG